VNALEVIWPLRGSVGIARQHAALFGTIVSFSASLDARDVSCGNSLQRLTVADALVDDATKVLRQGDAGVAGG
jgi:hypothetical protein